MGLVCVHSVTEINMRVSLNKQPRWKENLPFKTDHGMMVNSKIILNMVKVVTNLMKINTMKDNFLKIKLQEKENMFYRMGLSMKVYLMREDSMD